MLIFNTLWHITQHSFSRGLSSSQMKRKLCEYFSKCHFLRNNISNSIFAPQYFNFHLNSKLVELFVGGHSAKPQLRTFASVHQPWTPLTISRHIFTDWRNGQTRENWQGAEYERMRRCRVLGKEWMVTVWREKGAEMRWIIGGTPACLHAHTITTQTHNHSTCTDKHKHKETKTNTAT